MVQITFTHFTWQLFISIQFPAKLPNFEFEMMIFEFLAHIVSFLLHFVIDKFQIILFLSKFLNLSLSTCYLKKTR